MAVPIREKGEAERVQIELFRSAGSARRAALARSLTSSVVNLARQAIRDRHPEYSERDVLLAFVAHHYGEELSRRVRRYLDEE